MSRALDDFVAAAPWPQRTGLRVLLAIGTRPRGKALLARAPALVQATGSTLALIHYDEETVARSLGFDAQAVVGRGRALRRAEGRP